MDGLLHKLAWLISRVNAEPAEIYFILIGMSWE